VPSKNGQLESIARMLVQQMLALMEEDLPPVQVPKLGAMLQ